MNRRVGQDCTVHPAVRVGLGNSVFQGYVRRLTAADWPRIAGPEGLIDRFNASV